MENKRIEKTSKNPESLAAVHTHTHTHRCSRNEDNEIRIRGKPPS